MNLPLPLEQQANRKSDDTASRLGEFLRRREGELIAFRRDIHAHPELGRQELRTTALIARLLEQEELKPQTLPGGTGVMCDIDPTEGGTEDDPGHHSGGAAHPGSTPVDPHAAGSHTPGRLAIRADIDALPIQEVGDLPFRSTVEGGSHACGHDVHAATVLGAGLFLAEEARRGRLRRPVRLIFQPAEEVLPGGSIDMIENGALDGVGQIVAVHCDPRVDAGHVGLRSGALTAACDKLTLSLSGPGGHTSRPHLTVDLVYALAGMVTELPALLSRRIDPRAGVSMVWGAINAGHAANAIPQYGEAHGTVRCMDQRAWASAPDVINELVDTIAAAYGAKTELHYVRGVPPVINDEFTVDLLREAAHRAAGPEAVVPVEQSLGGEDFSWYLQRVPGAMARLGVRSPGDPVPRDLHQPSFRADESAIAVGVRLFAEAALG
jgi:amidohydrolase